MARKHTGDRRALINIYNQIYLPARLVSTHPKERINDSIGATIEYNLRIGERCDALKEDLCSYEALMQLRKEFEGYRVFRYYMRKRVRNRRHTPKKLLNALNEFSVEEIIELMADAELARYDRYFEEHPTLIRPSAAEVLRKKGSMKKMRTQTLLELYSSTYFSDNIRLKIEQALLENPKELYPAARSMKRKFIIHAGTTNTGKTYNAINALKAAETGAYLGPLRLLAFEIQENLLMSEVMCSLRTGEEEDIVRYETHMSSTVEMVNLYSHYDVAVIDECQMIGDRFRGSAWTRAVLGVRAPVVHLCTAPDAVDILVKIIEDCGDEYEIINYERRTPIMYDKSLDTGAVTHWEREDGIYKKPSCEERLRKINIDKLQYGDALIAFSRADVLEIAEILRGRGIEASVIYGALPYHARKKQLEMFTRRETQIIVATDAIGMGLNLPIRRVIFTVAHKFDGERYRVLYPSEIKQIAGRAGRIGIFDEGFVYSTEYPEYIKSAINAEIAPIEKAHINFDASFVEIDYKLEDILKAWMHADMPFDIYDKIDMNRAIMLLRNIDRICERKGFTCSKETAYMLANVVFDESVRKVFLTWMDYVEDYLGGKETLPKPRISRSSLEKLEESFKKVDLYYSFCTTVGYEPDLDWITKTKSYLSDEINNRLRSER